MDEEIRLYNILPPVSVCAGMLIYFGYGVRHSVQKQRLLNNLVPIETIEDKPGKGGAKVECS